MAARSVVLLALAYAAFVSVGLPDGLLGVAWPGIRADFELPLDAIGALLGLSTAGYVASSFAAGWLLARLGVGTLLAVSCAATATALLAFAAAPAWWVLVGFASLLGLGAGAIDAGLNAHVAAHHSARTVSWLHACYGIGAAGGPALLAAALVAGRPWQWGYAVVGGAQLALALAFAATRGLWPAAPGTAAARHEARSRAGARDAPDAREAAVPPPTARSALAIPATWLGMAAFAVYTGLEVTAGAWLFSLFTQARGVTVATAGSWVSAFWIGLTVGRLVSGVVLRRARVTAVLRASTWLLLAAAAAIALGAGSGLASVALLGLGAGPIFPALIADTARRVGAAHARHVIGFQVAAAALGGAGLPALVGVVAERAGLDAVGAVLLAAAGVLAVLHEGLEAAVRARRLARRGPGTARVR